MNEEMESFSNNARDAMTKQFTLEEIKKAIKQQKKMKYPGANNITHEIMQCLGTTDNIELKIEKIQLCWIMTRYLLYTV